MNCFDTIFLSFPTGNYKGMCKQIDHFPEETDYEADPSEYFLREYHVSIFSLPIRLMNRLHIRLFSPRSLDIQSEYF